MSQVMAMKAGKQSLKLGESNPIVLNTGKVQSHTFKRAQIQVIALDPLTGFPHGIEHSGGDKISLKDMLIRNGCKVSKRRISLITWDDEMQMEYIEILETAETGFTGRLTLEEYHKYGAGDIASVAPDYVVGDNGVLYFEDYKKSAVGAEVTYYNSFLLSSNELHN